MAILGSWYHSNTLGDLKIHAEDAIKNLKEVSDAFDAIAVTGISGMLLGPLLSMELDKNLIIVRKSNDDTHGEPIEGHAMHGDKVLFVDDFTVSGKTYEKMRMAIKSISSEKSLSLNLVGAYWYTEGEFDKKFLEDK